jgi:hypothetical protein
MSGTRCVVVTVALLAGCRPEAMTTTTTTAADVRVMRVLAVELRGGTECAYALPSTLGFDERDDLDDPATEALDKWAACVGSPRLAGATVEIGGPASAADDRFDRRAQRIRELLARRGVDAQRVAVKPGTCARGSIAIEVKPLEVALDPAVH